MVPGRPGPAARQCTAQRRLASRQAGKPATASQTALSIGLHIVVSDAKRQRRREQIPEVRFDVVERGRARIMQRVERRERAQAAELRIGVYRADRRLADPVRAPGRDDLLRARRRVVRIDRAGRQVRRGGAGRAVVAEEREVRTAHVEVAGAQRQRPLLVPRAERPDLVRAEAAGRAAQAARGAEPEARAVDALELERVVHTVRVLQVIEVAGVRAVAGRPLRGGFEARGEIQIESWGDRKSVV